MHREPNELQTILKYLLCNIKKLSTCKYVDYRYCTLLVNDNHEYLILLTNDIHSYYIFLTK